MNDETEEHATSTNTTNGKKEQQRPPTTNWKRFIFDIVYRIVGAERTLQPNGKSPRNRHLVATTMMTMILTAAICLARSRCRFRGLLSKFQTLLWSSLRSIFKQPEYRSAVEVSLSVLQGLASKGLIKHAYVGASEIIFKEDHDSFANATTSTWKRSKLPPNSPAVQSSMVDLLTRGGCDDVSALPDSIWSRLSSPLLAALPFVYLGLMYRVLKNMNGTDMSSKIVNDNHLATRFQHVAGLDHVMVEVQDIVSYLQNPSSYTSLGALPPRGILLHGPPGSGKTLLAKAVAGEAKCNAFISCVGSDFCEMYVGRGASRIRSLFQRARSAAAKNWTDRWIFDFGWMDGTRSHRRPGVAIIFIDELDALAKSRTFGGVAGNDERDQTLNQLLAEMDGFSSSSSSSTANGDGKSVVIVIAATNRPGRDFTVKSKRIHAQHIPCSCSFSIHPPACLSVYF